MPVNELRRRDSWPPTILRLNDDELDDIADIEDIDVNPFSYFLTTPEDADDDLEDLSAGIESDEENTHPVREVSPSSLPRISDDLDDESYLTYEDVGRGFALPVTLQAFRDTHLSERNKKAAKILQESEIPHYHHVPPTPTLRGRGMVRLAAPGGRGRGQTHSLPRSRPRSWREPSPDVWSIPEEDEGQEQQDDSEDIISPLSLDESTDTRPPQLREEKTQSRQPVNSESPTSLPQKLKKKVRFALP